MIALKKRMEEAKLESDKKLLRQRANTLDDEIDAIIYKIYGLNPEEIEKL